MPESRRAQRAHKAHYSIRATRRGVTPLRGYLWGYDYNGQLKAPAGLTGITQVAAGRYHVLAVTPPPPTISPVADQSTLENTPTAAIPFTVGSLAVPLSSHTFTITVIP